MIDHPIVQQLIEQHVAATEAVLRRACAIAVQTGRTQLVAHPDTYIDPAWVGDRTVIRSDVMSQREVVEVDPTGAELALRRTET